MSLLCTCTKSQTQESHHSAPYSKIKKYTESKSKSSDYEVQAQLADVMTSWQADPSAYEILTVIGKGCNEAVTISLAEHIPTGFRVAVKRTNVEQCEIDFSVLQHEVVLCRQLHHENILPCLLSFVHDHEIWSIMPAMAYGSCKDLIHAFFTNGLPEQAISYILRDVLHALDYLHDRGVIHRSVKASHIMISANGSVVLSGFRNAFDTVQNGKRLRIVHDFPKYGTGSLQWLSPEILEQNLSGYDTKSDIYSVGITACELANGSTPFIDMPVTQMLLEKVNGTKPVLVDSTTIADLILDDSPTGVQENGNGPIIDKHKVEIIDNANQRQFSVHFHNFVDLCLEKEPIKRPSASALFGHSYFKHLKKKTSEALPALLLPVSPLTDISKLPKVDSTSEEMAEGIENIMIEEDWEF